MIESFIIDKAKRIADTYGEWVRAGYIDRNKRLEELLKDITPNLIHEKAKELIRYRYNE